MARVTATEVKYIISTTISDDAVNVHITAANLIVTAQLADKSLSTEQLKEIERWLAAHFIAVQDPRKTEEELGEAREVLEGRNRSSTLNGIMGTQYGQQAVALDTSGTLATLGKRRARLESYPRD